MAINNDIDPGPAIIGMASGVRAISFRCCASLATFLLTPRRLLKVPDRRPNREVQIIIPPAIRSTAILIPKNSRIYFPKKKETTKLMNTLTDVHKAVRFLDRRESS